MGTSRHDVLVSRGPEPGDASQAIPAATAIALRRTSFGARPGDFDRVNSMGLIAYLAEQLNPAAIDDTECDQQLAALGLESLTKTLAQLWTDYRIGAANQPADKQYAWRIRPFTQTRDATWIRAVYSKRQLLEVMAEFWHNHFNVNALSNQDIASTWAHYDRDVIRANALGNFRVMLGLVAQSPAMLIFLNNLTNSNGGPNENYGRELLELHTLGAENYYNSLYSDVDAVPKDANGIAIGYIDQDVYEAARAFTGWTLANGRSVSGTTFPNTGEFYYYDGWHDRFQKLILNERLRNDQGPLVDGNQVLDLLASHPGTAHYICGKLARRFVSDNPSGALVQKAQQVWLANVDAPDQIAKVLQTILLSNELAASWGQKIKRPFDHTVAFLRGTAATFTPNNNLHYNLSLTGYRLFEWPTPAGHPDDASSWLSSNVMLRRWNLPNSLLASWFGAATFDLPGETAKGGATNCTQIVDYWSRRLLGVTLDATTRQVIIDFLAQGGAANQAPVATTGAPDWGSAQGVADRIVATVMLIVSTPDFQLR